MKGHRDIPWNNNLPHGVTSRDIEEHEDWDYESPANRRERIENEKADREEWKLE